MRSRWLPSLRSSALGLAALVAIGAACAAAQASPRDVAVKVHERGGYPSKLRIAPSASGAACAGGPAGTATGGHPDARVERAAPGAGGACSRSARAAHAASPTAAPFRLPWDGFALVLLTAVLGGLFILFGWLVSRRVTLGSDAAPAPEDAPPAEPGEIGDPEALAQSGRFEEAMRMLLLGALASVGWNPQAGAATTAREVVRGLSRGDARREPLAEIVRDAESVHFGGAAATRELYVAMREAFTRLSATGGAR